MSAIRPARAIDAAHHTTSAGLVPCVVQDWNTGEVLTLAYMNELALSDTRASGQLHLWSRSREEQWLKGETSGNVQAVRALRLDCDGDTAPRARRARRARLPHRRADLLSPRRARPAAPHEVLPALERTLRDARASSPRLLHGRAARRPARIGEKVMEEAEEVARAAREESDERVDEEAADVLYHLLVLLHSRGARSRTPSGCSMTVALASRAPLERGGASAEPRAARELRPHNLIPLRTASSRTARRPSRPF